MMGKNLFLLNWIYINRRDEQDQSKEVPFLRKLILNNKEIIKEMEECSSNLSIIQIGYFVWLCSSEFRQEYVELI